MEWSWGKLSSGCESSRSRTSVGRWGCPVGWAWCALFGGVGRQVKAVWWLREKQVGNVR